MEDTQVRMFEVTKTPGRPWRDWATHNRNRSHSNVFRQAVVCSVSGTKQLNEQPLWPHKLKLADWVYECLSVPNKGLGEVDVKENYHATHVILLLRQHWGALAAGVEEHARLVCREGPVHQPVSNTLKTAVTWLSSWVVNPWIWGLMTWWLTVQPSPYARYSLNLSQDIYF